MAPSTSPVWTRSQHRIICYAPSLPLRAVPPQTRGPAKHMRNPIVIAARQHASASPTVRCHITARSGPPVCCLEPLDQAETPLIDALEAAADAVRAPFFFPGHKMGAGAPQRLRRLLRGGGLRYDLPELPELDNLFAAEGPIARAQELAASAFGAGRTWFLVNGSTAGVIAAVLACCQLKLQRQPGQTPVVILPRNVHKSAIHALVSSGAEPLWLDPAYDAQSGLCLGMHAAEVERALRAGGERVAAVLVVSPTYHGLLSDVSAIAAACRGAGVPLIVDEAHGAHLEFVPAAAPLPAGWERARARGALWCGADVVVQSTHKTCGALTQARI